MFNHHAQADREVRVFIEKLYDLADHISPAADQMETLLRENKRMREALKVISQNRTDERRIYTEGCECDDFARAALEGKYV